MIEKKIYEILSTKLKDSKVFIQDMNGNGDHFSLIVISDDFESISDYLLILSLKQKF